MTKRLFLCLVLALFAMTKVAAQDELILEMLQPRGDVKRFTETRYDQPSDSVNFASNYNRRMVYVSEFDSQNRLVRFVGYRDTTLMFSKQCTYLEDATSYEIIRDAEGRIKRVNKAYFDKNGKVYRRFSHLTQSFLWNMPDNRCYYSYSRKGFLSNVMTRSRHGRFIDHFYHSRNHRGIPLRTEFENAKRDVLYHYSYYHTTQGDINWVGYYLVTASLTEELYHMVYTYDEKDNWVKGVFFKGDEKKLVSVITREIEYY